MKQLVGIGKASSENTYLVLYDRIPEIHLMTPSVTFL